MASCKVCRNEKWSNFRSSLRPRQTFPVTQGLGSSAGLSYAPYLTPMSHSMGLVPADFQSSAPVIVPGSPPVSVTAGSSSSQKLLRADKLEVTRRTGAIFIFAKSECVTSEWLFVRKERKWSRIVFFFFNICFFILGLNSKCVKVDLQTENGKKNMAAKLLKKKFL